MPLIVLALRRINPMRVNWTRTNIWVQRSRNPLPLSSTARPLFSLCARTVLFRVSRPWKTIWNDIERRMTTHKAGAYEYRIEGESATDHGKAGYKIYEIIDCVTFLFAHHFSFYVVCFLFKIINASNQQKKNTSWWIISGQLWSYQ